MTCQECYTKESRITPLLNPLECLENHTQYLCGSCGRLICIERDPQRHLQRWNFPFKSLEIAKLYLRTADYTEKKVCGIYKIKNSKGRISYKIFAEAEDLALYLHKNKDKFSEGGLPVYSARKYRDFEGTEVRKVSADEIEKYLSERKTPIVD